MWGLGSLRCACTAQAHLLKVLRCALLPRRAPHMMLQLHSNQRSEEPLAKRKLGEGSHAVEARSLPRRFHVMQAAHGAQLVGARVLRYPCAGAWSVAKSACVKLLESTR